MFVFLLQFKCFALEANFLFCFQDYNQREFVRVPIHKLDRSGLGELCTEFTQKSFALNAHYRKQEATQKGSRGASKQNIHGALILCCWFKMGK